MTFDQDTSARAVVRTVPDSVSPARAEHLELIRTLGRLLDDLEHVRVQNGNRIGALEREFGGSLPQLDVIQRQLHVTEDVAILELKRAWRKHPLAAWAKEQRGVGEKSIARLIAEVGDVAARPNVAKLWAYCGVGNPHLKKHKGMSQDAAFALGNPRAKKQVWLIANSAIKQQCVTCRENKGEGWTPPADGCTCPPLRMSYDTARAHYAAREWTDGHKHAAALRKVGKDFLKELWIASCHSPSEGPQTRVTDQRERAGGDS